jgi:carboxyl-terminal processing protease
VQPEENTVLGRIASLTVAVLLTSIAVVASYGSGFAANQLLQGYGLESGDQTVPSEMASDFPVYIEAHDIVRRDYYHKSSLNEQEMAYGAIDGLIDSLGDPHTAFITPTHAAILSTELEGSFEGIGATLESRDGRFVIVAPLQGSPAAQAGIQSGDLLITVDGQQVEHMDLLEVIMLIRGPKGSSVLLTVHREGVEAPIDIEILRSTIDLPVVDGRMLEDSIAYIHPVQFSGRLMDEMIPLMENLLDQDPRGLILDLRGNPGGYLNVAIEVGSQFIDDGPILLERDKSGNLKKYKALSGGIATDISLVVLVDQGSASASEIVAGAVQDSHRGVLIGQRTFGKGSVQAVHELKDGSSLHLTTSHWLTPNGREIEGEGISPDISVEPQDEDGLETHDMAIRRALEWFDAQDADDSSLTAALELV